MCACGKKPGKGKAKIRGAIKAGPPKVQVQQPSGGS